MGDTAARRVVHAIGTSAVGGTERFLVDLLVRHRSLGIDSYVCVLDGPGAVAEEYRRVASRLAHLNLRAEPIGGVRRWRRFLGEIGPDVLVLYGFRANLLGRVLRGRDRPAVVAALRSTTVDEHGRAAAGWIDKLTFGRVDVCVANSRTALERLVERGYPARRLAYIAPGVDTHPFLRGDRRAARRNLGASEDAPVLLCVANLKRVKNHALLLRASALLASRGVSHRLWIVGDGPERQQLEMLARELRLEGTVVFTGHDPDPLSRYLAADIFVLASRWEGTPNAVLEAMAAGLPVVAPPVGDLGELVVDGVTGRLVAPDDVEAFAAGISDVLPAATRRSYGEAARTRAAAFDVDVAARDYAELFEWAASGKRGRIPFEYVVSKD